MSTKQLKLQVTNVHDYLLLILPMRGVQGLDQVSSMAEEHGVARGPDYHADHGEPNIGHALWRVSTISYAQHVTHGHKQSVGVLDVPCRVLKKVVNNEAR